MKKLYLFLNVLLVVLSCNHSYAVSLDEPALKKITVRSELNRGRKIEQECDPYLMREIQKYKKCIDDKISKNEQNNTDTDAFILGINFRAWIHIYMTLDSMELKRIEGYQLWNYRELIAANYYSEFRKRQEKLKLNDRTMIEASG